MASVPFRFAIWRARALRGRPRGVGEEEEGRHAHTGTGGIMTLVGRRGVRPGTGGERKSYFLTCLFVARLLLLLFYK